MTNEKINISNLRGIYHAIAEKANLNKDGFLDEVSSNGEREISLFNQIRSTIKNNTFMYKGQIYNADGSIFGQDAPQDVTKINTQASVYSELTLSSEKRGFVGEKLSETNDYVLKLPENLEKEELIKADKVALKDAELAKLRKTIKLIPTQNINTNYSIFNNDKTVYDKDILAKALNNILEINSKMKNLVPFYIEAFKDDNVNPFVMIAISMHESAKGMSNAAIKKNNVSGLCAGGKPKCFNNVKECIDTMSNVIRNRVKAGNKTISQIAYSGKYCTKLAAGEWQRNVVKHLTELVKEYNKLVSEFKAS